MESEGIWYEVMEWMLCVSTDRIERSLKQDD